MQMQAYTVARPGQVCASLLVILVAAAHPAAAAQPPDTPAGVTVLQARSTGEATFIVGQDGGAIPLSPLAAAEADRPLAFLHSHGQLFGIEDAARQLVPDAQRTRVDKLGRRLTTYLQVHGDVSVFTGMVKVHQNQQGDVVAANGDFYVIPDKLRTTPTLDAAQAETLAAATIQAELPDSRPQPDTVELTIVDPGWYGDRAQGARLAWYLVMEDLTWGVREALFVDAHSGEIVDRWSLLEGVRLRITYNGKQRAALPGDVARLENDPPVDLPAGQNSLERDINRAHDYAADVYGYFSRAFGYDSLDGEGVFIQQTVNSAAFPCPNAAWLGQQAAYCLGMASDDVVAHELMHGITSFNASLVYQNQPGQLNEAYSDIFGELVDLFNGNAAFEGTIGGTAWPMDAGYADNDGDSPNLSRAAETCVSNFATQGVRWLLAEDIGFLGFNPIRDMWTPPCFGHPDRAFSTLQTCGGPGGSDNGGVHSGSGIPNHAFAIMVDGKNFNGRQVGSMGPIKAGAVWFRAMNTYLTPGADFEDAYHALVQSALDLVGTFPNDPRTGLPSDSMFSDLDAGRVDTALQAVEMNTEGRCGATQPLLDPSPPALCPDRAILFRDTFDDGVMDWGVSNSGPLTPYNWIIRDELPIGRPGFALYAENADIGTCQPGNDETGRHELWSPPIDLPSAGLVSPSVVFTHFVAIEPRFDGGNIRLRIDSSDWNLLPPERLTYNTYNATLVTSDGGNTNPLAGLPAFSGAGNAWAQTVIDLTGLVTGGERIQFRFDFGKDGCSGIDGWYIDDFEVFHCGGCTSSATCDDGDECTVDYCASGVCASQALPLCGGALLADPPSGSIDARQPHDRTVPGSIQTWSTVDVLLVGGEEFPPDVAAVSEVGGDGVAPTVVGVERIDPARVRVTLSEPLEPASWIVLSLNGTNARACLASLPGDVNASRTTNASDLTALINALNTAGAAAPIFATDVNRSGATNAQDITALVDLLNGAGVFDPWLSRSLPPSPCGS